MRGDTKLAGAATIVIAALAVFGWWFARAPGIEHEAVAPPPDIDIDPPVMRARREAALALALMPDDPWTFAESLAASAPDKPVEKEDCGLEGRARFSDSGEAGDQSVQIGGESARYAGAQARIDAALRASADPLDRAVADLVNVGDMRNEVGRNEAVVRQAAMSTDPRLYALGYGLCNSVFPAVESCRAISLDRWIEIDPDNGIPWVLMLNQAQARGDAAGMRTAMSHMASATRFDVYMASAAGAVASRMSKDEQEVAAVGDLASKAFMLSSTGTIPPYQPLVQVCKRQASGDVELARTCLAISDVMYAHSDNMISYALSGALMLQTTGDTSRRELIRAENAVAAAHWSPATGFSECRVLREQTKRLLRTSQVGDVEVMRELARKFVTP
jgi:hypothetical protein